MNKQGVGRLPSPGEGVRFKCTGCGKCCSGGEGFVWVTAHEIREMAAYLEMSVEEFAQRYLRLVGNRYSLRELPNGKPGEFDCILLDGKECRVYGARPVQCRTFPFWPANMESEQDWQETLAECEGICEEAPVVPPEEVERQLKQQQKAIADSYNAWQAFS